MGTYGGYAWGMAPIPVCIVGLIHTLRRRVGNQCMKFPSEKFW